MGNTYRTLRLLSKDMDDLIIREFIRSAVENYDERATNVIYDGERIELFSKESHDFRKHNKHFTSYMVSHPINFV